MGVKKEPETTIFRAQDLLGERAPDLNLRTYNPFPDFKDPEDGHQRFIHDAKAIVDALCQTLPGGTIDQVLVELLLHRASELRVPKNAHN